jgi:uncharacterized protein (DUF58 family)
MGILPVLGCANFQIPHSKFHSSLSCKGPPLKTGSPIIKWIAFMAAGVFIGSVGVILSVEQMYFMAACLFLTPVVSLVIGWILLLGLKAARRLPTTVDEGEEIDVEITLQNTGRLPKFFITVFDKLPVWIKDAGSSGNTILQLDPAEERSITYRLKTEKRGVYQVGPVRLSATDPFGFFTFKRSVPGTTELVVYPSPLPLFSSVIQPGAYGWRGDADGLRRGSGADFHGVREYQHGDELRRVHWRTTARTGKLAVAEYTQGETLDMVLAIDLNEKAHAGAASGLDSPVECAVKIAATLSEDFTRNGHTVRLLTTCWTSDDPVPTNSGKWTAPLLEALARAEVGSKSTLAETLGAFRSQVQQGSMIIYLTPDASDATLSTVLAEYERLGVLTAGFALDGVSFGLRGLPGRGAVDTILAGPVRPVRRGDDLVEAIHDLLGRNRGARLRERAVAVGGHA